MKIPQRLAYILERDPQLDGLVKVAVGEFEPWIKNSNLPFFPEYTKHDIDHIESVLKTVVSLIRDDAWAAITPNDAAVLVIAVLLHDCAMHITEDGFFSLFDHKRTRKIIQGINDKPWDILWEEFYGEASRFDGQKLTRLFGDALPVRRPPKDANQFTKRDRLLIGEFLRRYHPRLAHEIALYGVPTSGAIPLILIGFQGDKSYIPALAGIVARSHGDEIRAFLPYLKNNFDIRQYKNVHPVFLMALLRVSDYLQIDSERAPAQVLQVKSLASPISKGEWRAHQAIKDVRNTMEDPEALFIDALPEDVETYFKVKSWVCGIQYELDASWAVIGEVFGRYEGLNRFGLLLRRVQSSLDDINSFAKKVNYIPQKAVFRAADADLLKLLIEPLYGNNPEVGLRELIQNSIDAVRELKQYQDDVSLPGDLQQAELDADVEVRIENISEDSDYAVVTVSDKGIGMSSEIITNYFLAAGASFRRSDEWKKTFEDKDGKSKVLRAGRFGVGALASFLLGPEIEVVTRHIEEVDGISFKAGVDSELIELKKIDCPVGTTIKVKIHKKLADRLCKASWESYESRFAGRAWDWYFLATPRLKRLGFGTELKSECSIPDLNDVLPEEWRKTTHPDYDGILWTYSPIWRNMRVGGSLFCNGLGVYLTKHFADPVRWEEKYDLILPHISVFDSNGRLPLNLQRTDLAVPEFPFSEALLMDIIKDFIAYALVYGPITAPEKYNYSANITGLSYPGSARSFGYSFQRQSHDWYFTSDGFGYLSPQNFKINSYTSALIIQLTERHSGTIQFSPQKEWPVIVAQGAETLTDLDSTIRALLELGCSHGIWSLESGNSAIKSLKHFPRVGTRLLVSDFALDRANRKGSRKLTKALREAMRIEWRKDGWTLLSIGKCPAQVFDFAEFVNANGEHLGEQSLLSEVYFDNTKASTSSFVADQWMKILKVPEIPFNIAQRQEKLKYAYSELASYVTAHEEIKHKKDEEKKMRELKAAALKKANNGLRGE